MEARPYILYIGNCISIINITKNRLTCQEFYAILKFMENDNIIYGKNAVLEYLLSGKAVDTLYVAKGVHNLSRHIKLAKERGAVVKDCDNAKLDALCGGGGGKYPASVSGNGGKYPASAPGNGGKHPASAPDKTDSQPKNHGGILLTIPAIEYATLEQLIAVSRDKATAPFIIAADEITDPHNLGALIRTAEAAGADGLIIPKRRSAQVNSTVFSTSAGAASHLKICRVDNLNDALNKLKQHKVWVYGAEADGTPFRKQDYTSGTCLVIGSEGSGLRRLVREACDVVIAVDMRGKINSLNASVCGGVLMYEVQRQREIMQNAECRMQK
ncbi:MAG: 23S rRNA (guanosine(2251)-2'-O)-methyltransferase RlmB [Oscillospiraceae bacterium]|nr:23S rRNA (guanosine(2251)-2'-O)-methyltransferase RlmB [Oscillospiraceae bacterium]